MARAPAGAVEFWAKVRKTPSCWLWTGKKNAYGYGLVRRRTVSSNMIKAHRYSWELTRASPLKNLFVLHRCDVRACVNPKHLFLGTQRDNAKDMWAKGRAKPTPSIGSKHGNAKLTEKSILQIRKSYKNGDSLAALGRKFNVTAENIAHIVHRRAWTHV